LCLEEREKLVTEVFDQLQALDKGSANATHTKALLLKKPTPQDFRRAREKLQPGAIFTRYGSRVKHQ